MSTPVTARAIVVTTINAPTDAVLALRAGVEPRVWQLIVVGDTKTPDQTFEDYPHYLSIDAQRSQFPELCEVLPTKHYARKNVGYLLAKKLGAAQIKETDDDNYPLDSFWSLWPEPMEVEALRSDLPWFNVYQLFTDTHIWPRGLPLESIRTEPKFELTSARSRALIVQDLADENPDVDAIYRLTLPLPVSFRQRKPVLFSTGVWCPFNSQNTAFHRDVFPLLYLPATCSFRMTDIWRSFVAQRCLWELGEGVVFRSSTMYQLRNEHNLLRDFEDEIPGYLYNDQIRAALDALKLDTDLSRGLIRCYEQLVEKGFVKKEELPIVRAWCAELEKLS